MKSIDCRKKLLPQHLILLALLLTVSFRDAHADDMDIVKKYAETDSIKVVFLESKPNPTIQASNALEKVVQTFETGDEIEVTVKDESAVERDSVSEQKMKSLEVQRNHLSRQRQLAREQLSRASENIQRGELSASSKYYRDLLESYKKLDEKYQQILVDMKPEAKTAKPTKSVFTVLSREQILKELNKKNSGERRVLMIRRISFKDLAKGASGFIVAAGVTAQAMASDHAAKKAEASPRIVQPKPYQATGTE